MKLPKEVSLERELQVWSLRQQMWTQSRIAAYLGISQPAVTKILKRLCERYIKENLDELEQVKSEQILQLDNIAFEAMQAWELSKQHGQTGDPRYLIAVMKAQEDIRKIVGIETYIKFTVTKEISNNSRYRELSHLSDNELFAQVKDIFNKKEEEEANPHEFTPLADNPN